MTSIVLFPLVQSEGTVQLVPEVRKITVANAGTGMPARRRRNTVDAKSCAHFQICIR
jgi:hypothetical protein